MDASAYQAEDNDENDNNPIDDLYCRHLQVERHLVILSFDDLIRAEV